MSPPSFPIIERGVKYADEHDRQTLDIFIPHPLNPSQDRNSRVWLIFIHGGAWCDPCQTSAELQPALNLLYPEGSLGHDFATQQWIKQARDRIAGYASINYGLSPRPGDPSNEESRNVRHPRHLLDVVKALHWLGREYDVGTETGWMYILMGHSCGATIAFQLAIGLLKEDGGESGFGKGVERPIGLVGLEGLYDLPLLVKNHNDEEFYREFVESAFPGGERVWRDVSPVSADRDRFWEDVRVVILGMSREDELVEWEQVEVMRRAVDPIRGRESKGKLKLLELDGRHDEAWEKGMGVLRALEAALRLMFGKE